MKTAMQELIEKVEHAISYNVEGGLVEKYTWTELFNDMELALQKEKEQIVDACNANLKGLLTNGKDYYDLNFNHHIESEPNTYTNFTPHNANAVAEYNEGLKNFTPNK